MSTQTPGPWVAHNKTVWVMESFDQDRIGVIANTNSGRPDGEDEANARLIASAPDMLDAIADIAAITTGDVTEDTLAEIQGICRAALAKAKGA
mgnify:CR=1 FL=1